MLVIRAPRTVSEAIDPVESRMIDGRSMTSSTSSTMPMTSIRSMIGVEVDARHGGVQVDRRHHGVQVDPVDDRVDVDPRHGGVQVDRRHHRVQVDPVDDRADVEPRRHRVQVDPSTTASRSSRA